MVVFSLWRWSSFLPSGFLVSRRTPDTLNLRNHFDYKTFTSFGLLFQNSSSMITLDLSESLPRTYCYIRFGLVRFRSPLLSESLIYFLFLRVIRCFSSPGSPRNTMDSCYDTTTLLVVSSLIRISTDQDLFAVPRSFSQLVTSFFGAMYQGILRSLFVAYSFSLKSFLQKNSVLTLEVLYYSY